jgi:transcriptional regulator with XRE-family HTH domain
VSGATDQKLFKTQFCGVAKTLYALGGGEDELAAALGITRAELAGWENDYPEFNEACDAGRSAAADRVEESLRKLCAGYDIVAEEIWLYRCRVMRQEYKKSILPDSAACQFYLTNMERRNWKLPKDVPGRAAKDLVREWFEDTEFETIRPKDPPRDGRPY